MTKLVTFLKTFGADESGATMVEYAIMVGLIAALLIAAILGVSDYLANAWEHLKTELTGVTPFSS
jgi:pilus assembly protein Flp/PilA